MKLIIDMPEDTVNAIKDNAMFAKPIADQIQWDVTSAVVNGTPLEDVKAEIEEQKKDRCFDDMFEYITGLDDALYILDKYKAGSEEEE